jgi:hypothetical protein
MSLLDHNYYVAGVAALTLIIYLATRKPKQGPFPPGPKGLLLVGSRA